QRVRLEYVARHDDELRAALLRQPPDAAHRLQPIRGKARLRLTVVVFQEPPGHAQLPVGGVEEADGTSGRGARRILSHAPIPIRGPGLPPSVMFERTPDAARTALSAAARTRGRGVPGRGRRDAHSSSSKDSATTPSSSPPCVSRSGRDAESSKDGGDLR